MRARLALGLAVATVVAGLGAAQVRTAAPAAAVTTTVVSARPANPGIRPVTPVRVLDTRTGLGAPLAKLAAGASLDLSLTGRAVAGDSVLMNVTLSGAAGGGSLTAYPTGTVKPLGTMNFSTGVTVSSQVIVKVGSTDRVRFTNNGGAVNVIADLTGVIPALQQYTSLTPTRLLDTRSGLGAPVGQVGPGGTVDLAVAGRGGVPATGASAVVLNVIGVGPTVATTIGVFPSGAVRADTTALAVGAGLNRAATVVMPLGTGGRASLRNATGSTHLVADVSGWFSADGAYVPRNPFRLADTRTGLGLGGAVAKLGPKQSLVLNLGTDPAPAGAKQAALVSITAIRPTAATFLTASADGPIAVPSTSSLSAPAGAVTSNIALVPMGGFTVGFNDFTVYNQAGSTDVTVDVLGWVAQPLTTLPALFPEAAVGIPYRQQLFSAAGEGSTRTWSAGSPMPAGFAVSASGLLTGTPGAAGTLSVPVRVTDAVGATATVTISVPVAPIGSSALWGWGNNSSYMLGVDPALLSRTVTPAQVHEPGPAVQAAGGQGTGYALGADGTVWGWGLNTSGQAGQPPATAVVIRPVRIAGLAGVTAIAANTSNGYALKADGTVWAWGAAGGRLGNGTTAGSSTPVQVSALTGVKAIASSPLGTSVFALKTDGTVWSWGGGGLVSTLGTGAAQSLVPAQIPGLAGITAIGAGDLNGFAVDATGGLHAWGVNSSGQIGDGTTTLRPTPVLVPGLTGVTAATAGRLTSYARTSDGSVWAWGGGASGQLGTGTTANSLVPVRVPGLTGVTQIAAGLVDAAALTTDGSVWMWGSLSQGYTALGGAGTRLAPERATLLPPVAHLDRSQAGYFAVGRP